MPSALRSLVFRSLPLVALALLAGCTIAKPRTDDPYEKFNRKVYSFNDSLDKAIIRPVAVGYRDVTNTTIRRCVSDFFTNMRQPISVANPSRPYKAADVSWSI
jgi:phospholipid-binding lipoprotein MlaA